MIRKLKIIEQDIELVTAYIQRSLNVIEACAKILALDKYSYISIERCVEWLIGAKANIQAIIGVYLKNE